MSDAVLASASTTEVCVARKRARGLESRRSRKYACRALCHAFVGVSVACRARFCCVLAPRGFWPFSARDGPRFSAGFARRGCGLPRLGFCEFRVRMRRFAPRCTSNREIHGSNPGKRVFRLNDLKTQNLRKSTLPELADIGRRSNTHLWPHALTRVPLVV